jgi:predicted enzyme related to lactoylglutathione lyase
MSPARLAPSRESVHLPSHPVWFWLLLGAPWILSLLMWIAASTLKISLKPLKRWLLWAYILFWIPSSIVSLMDGHKTLRVALYAAGFSCWGMAIVIQRYYLFERLTAPGTKWYFPWKVAGFSVPNETRIQVKSIDAVSPWYIEKLGLRKLNESDYGEPDVATFRFKQDGNSFVLTTRGGFHSDKTPILFTRRIGRMRKVMAARGVAVGDIQLDRQGIRYFDIRDPEGNEIEIVQES